MIPRFLALVVCCTAVVLLVGEAAPTQSTAPFLVGFADDLPQTPIRFSIDVGEVGEKQIRVDVSASNDATPADNTATATLVIRAPAPGAVARGTSRRGVTRVGAAGADRLVGTAFADLLRGGAGNDRIIGGGGNDTLIGGPGRDLIDGNGGDDRIVTRDGTRDTVRCGAGSDVVVADRYDATARDCNVVSRR